MGIIKSINNVPVRLTEERWFHITEEHSEMAGYYYDVLETVQKPDGIYEGKFGELLGVKGLSPKKYLIIVYKEVNKDNGFVITAFLTKRIKQIERRRKLWPL